jgi:hypothetical protein
MLRNVRRFGLYVGILGLTLALGATVSAQNDPFVGSWLLNLEKSDVTSPSAEIRERIFKIERKGNVYPHSQETFRVGSDALQRIWYDATYDGKEAKVTGGAFDAVTFSRDGNTLTRKAFNRGTEVETATFTVSADGKTMTIVTKGKNYGVEYGSTQIFEKQAPSGTR